MSELEQSIVATLVYYDVLDRPLTGWEVFRYLVKTGNRNKAGRTKFGFENVLQTLENSSCLARLISQKNGFYFLKKRADLVKERIERQKEAEKKWKKARRIIGFLRAIPFICLIMVSGSLAQNNTREDSDIDLLIIAKAGRIWTCRALVTMFLHLVAQRRHGYLIKNRICLNHYLTDTSLAIVSQSLYNAQTYVHLTPVWQKPGLRLDRDFQQINGWIGNYLYFYPGYEQGYLRKIKAGRFLSFGRKDSKRFLNKRLGDTLENLCKQVQSKKIRRNPETYRAGGRVVFNDEQLEFHNNSPERGIIEEYNRKMKALGLKEWAREKDSGLTV